MQKIFKRVGVAVLAAMISLWPLSAAAADNGELVFELKAPDAPTLHIEHTDHGLIVREYKGKVVVLNFFGKHCKWCMKEIPHLVKLQKEYGGKIQVIAVHAQQPMTPGERSRLNERFHFNYPIYEYKQNGEFVYYISQRTQWQGGLPFTLVFDPDGNFVYALRGYAPEADLKKVIDFALTESRKVARKKQ